MGNGGKLVILIAVACRGAAGGHRGHPIQVVVGIGGALGVAAAAHGDAGIHTVLGIVCIGGFCSPGIRLRADVPAVGRVRSGGIHIGDRLQNPLLSLRGGVSGGNRCDGGVEAVPGHAQGFAGICLAGNPVGAVAVFGKAEFLVIASVFAKLPYRFVAIYQGGRYLEHLIVIGAGMNVKPAVLAWNSFQGVPLILSAVVVILVDQGVVSCREPFYIEIFSCQP